MHGAALEWLNLDLHEGCLGQGRSSSDPIRFRLHSNYLTMSVLRYLTYERPAVFFGHPILWFYLFFGVHIRLEFVFQRYIRSHGLCIWFVTKLKHNALYGVMV